MQKFVMFNFFALLTITAYSVELWNGFTTDMTVEMAIEKAQAELSPREIDVGEGYYIATVPSYDDFGYPSPLTRVSFHSELSEYASGTNINMYFYYQKLFCMIISWKYEDLASTQKEVVANMAKSKYGNPSQTIRIPNWGRRPYNVYYWRLPGKDFYVDLNQFCFVDSAARAPWVAEQTQRQAEEAARRREQDAQRQRDAESTIHF